MACLVARAEFCGLEVIFVATDILLSSAEFGGLVPQLRICYNMLLEFDRILRKTQKKLLYHFCKKNRFTVLYRF